MVAVQMGEGSRGPKFCRRFSFWEWLYGYSPPRRRRDLCQEVFSRASYSQAEHFLHGDVSLDVNAIVHEVLIVDGKARMYFGLFPAFLRIPLNYIYPSG
jgi:hypothetical protein